MTLPHFQQLTPECILDAVDQSGFVSTGRLLALNSYENRVYQVDIEDTAPVIAKFYRRGRWSDTAILEEHQLLNELVAQEIPAVAALKCNGQSLNIFHHFRFALFPKHAGRAPELDSFGVLERIGRFIGRIHAVGILSSFKQRPAINIDTFGFSAREYLITHQFIPPDLLSSYQSSTNLLLEGIQRSFERAGSITQLRLHGDCHLGNVLWTEEGPHFVDFDDSRMGPAIQDLWMLLSGSRGEMTQQLADLLAGYNDFMEFNPRELHLIEALRSLRLLHYSAWLAQRWEDPAFKIAFPWFNTQHYWQNRILELREQCALMDEAPLCI
ncbi:MAG: phosphotransferase enzyme family protein [Solimicrobium sp.]|jgi:Ser/Thr protein kinase RdoA (MazF antagonist)|nr:phosphotransferase enzyme family protein [Solimicrobium sp.]